ncbi:MAG: RluA family pseudouridine synthase [Acidobacteria bacterium]|nr:RluA family pseudouridine synthase [Acidobacteriota bacterium]
MPETPVTFQPKPERRRPEAEDVPLSVLYEDEFLLAIDKPAGMVVHPTYKNWSGTLLNGLLWRVRDQGPIVPSIITRLDKQTSGLVLVALSAVIHAQVQRDAAAGLVKKEYLAVVEGAPSPDSGTIALPLARSPEDRRRVVVTDSGQPSETRYEVLSTTGDQSVVRCELVTGRTHQIRVHLAHNGWPIIGDEVYGTPHPSLNRQALHAWRLRLTHPVTRQPLEIEAPIPPDLRQVMADQNFTL